MVQSVVTPEHPGIIAAVQDELQKAFRWMLLARALDDKMASLYRGGKIHGGVFLGKGQEALSVAIGMALRPGDIFAPLIRDTAGRLAFGEKILDAVRTYLGSVLGPMRGRDGNVHRGYPREGLLPMISHLGAMISVVNGMLMGRRFKGIEGVVGATCIGDGGTSTGAFHEALNQAAVEHLPLVMVIADNQYAYSTPTDRQFACASLADRAAGYGIESHTLDGTDLPECLRILELAVARARDGRGPQMVVASLLRLCGHGEHDDAQYVTSELKNSPLGRDCLERAETMLVNGGVLDAETVQGWRHEAMTLIDAAIGQVQREPTPDPYVETWCPLATPHLREGHERS